MSTGSVRRAAWAAGLVAVCCLAVAAVVVAARTLNRTAGGAPGDLAGWIEATATLAAVPIATVAAFFAVQAYRIEDRRDERLAEGLRRHQASLVAAWLDGRHRDKVELRNASELPVTDVRIMLELEGLTHHGPELHEEPEWKTVWYAEQTISVLPPAVAPISVTIDDWPGMVSAEHLLQSTPASQLHVSILFRDANNVVWARDETGLLREQTAPA